MTTTLQPDCKAAILAVGVVAKSDTYQGEVLNYETPAQFFGQLTEKLWDIVMLAALGLLERTESGGVSCPFMSMHIDMHMQAA
jgi:hypothetical protein